MQPTNQPLTINLPDGGTIQSTYTCQLNMPWLPAKARVANIVPGLAHTSLVSISTLCDAGCKVKYNESTCDVYFNNRKVWTGQREPTTGLWILPLNPTKSGNLPRGHRPRKQQHRANNAHTMSSKEWLIKYLHQALFSPAKATLIKAIENNQFASWPGLTADAVKKYLPDSSPATDKEHMKQIDSFRWL